MTSAMGRLSRTLFLSAPLIWALTAPGCENKSNPVLPSTGGTNPVGSVTGGDVDGGAPRDSLPTSEVQEDTADAATPNGNCDLLTYIRTQQGCPATPTRQACYPVSGSGKCQPVGNLGAFNTCLPGDKTGTLTCAEKLACISTADMGPVCLSLCDSTQPACDNESVCELLNGFTNVGSCRL